MIFMELSSWFKENLLDPISKANQYLSDRFSNRKFKQLVVLENDNCPLRLAKQSGTVLYNAAQLSFDLVALPVYGLCKGVMYLSDSEPKSGLLKTIQENSLTHCAGNVVTDIFAMVFDTTKLALYTYRRPC
jgi:hypothetical protein